MRNIAVDEVSPTNMSFWVHLEYEVVIGLRQHIVGAT